MAQLDSPTIGIDLGTTYSCVATFVNGKVEIIQNEQGNYTTPSYVSYTETERLIGDAAKSRGRINHKNTIYDAKRLIGRKYDDTNIAEDMTKWPFDVLNVHGLPKYQVEYKLQRRLFSPEEISSVILSKMKQIATKHLGSAVTNAVITVPANFNNAQREATKDAARIAGLNLLGMIHEPAAAAIAYGLEKNLQGEKKVMIFDFGGGTLDVSILLIKEGPVFEVKATTGSTHLGGDDIDNLMVDHLVEVFKDKYQKDVTTNRRSMHRLRTACEEAKRVLTSATSANIDLDNFFEGIDFCTSISRAKFELLCDNVFQSALKPVRNALADAKLEIRSIDDIVLVGGSTRIPKVQKVLSDLFHWKELINSIDPETAVAYGAAVRAAQLDGNTSEKIKDVMLIDITPLPLGIEVYGGTMTNLIDRNTVIPCTRSKLFTTVKDNQRAVKIKIFEGERSIVEHNTQLGEFELQDIPPAPKGSVKLQVIFKLDSNGILQISAEDKKTGKSGGINIIHNKGRLSEEELDSLLSEALQFEQEDKEEAKRIKLLINLEEYLYEVQHATSDSSDLLTDEEKTRVENFCESLKRWVTCNRLAEKEEINSKMEEAKNELSRYVKKLGLNIGIGRIDDVD